MSAQPTKKRPAPSDDSILILTDDDGATIKRQRVDPTLPIDPLVFFSKSKDRSARELSNFADSPICIGGRWFPTVEHYYQAQKFAVAGCAEFNREFSTEEEGGVPVVGATGLDAKKAGGKGVMKKRGVVLPLGLWDSEHRTPVMLKALQAKFKIPAFSRLLQATGDRPLHHFERRPGFWGTHVSSATGERKGDNMLGRMLEGFRKIINHKAAAVATADE